MSSKHSHSKSKMSLPASVAIGLGVGFILLLSGSAVLAWLIVAQKLPVESIGAGAGMLLVLASAAGCWISMHFGGEQRLQTAGIFAAAFLGVLLALTALVFGGQYSGVAVYGICILCGTGLPLLTAFLPKKARYTRRKLKSYR